MALRLRFKVLLHVCSYDFYDMTLSTEKQRRHMIKDFMEIQRLWKILLKLRLLVAGFHV